MRKSMLKLAVTVFMAGWASNASAEWHQVESAHFRIFSEGQEKDVVQYAQRLEAVHYLMKIATGMKDDRAANKVIVYYVDTVADLQRVLDAKATSNVAGIYVPSIRGSAAIVPRQNNNGIDPQAVLFHEYAHHFMLQYQPAAYPPWYVEGWAELVSTASFERKGSITFGKAANHRQYELANESWIPLRELMGRNDDVKDVINHQYGAYYGESWLLAHYLTLSDQRPGQLRAYLLAILNGKNDEQAWAAFGDVDALERELRGYLRARNFAYKAPALPAAVMAIQSVRTLRAGEAAVMADRIRAIRAGADERPTLLARLEAAAVQYPDEPAISLLLSEQYAEAKDWKKAAAAAGQAVARDPDLPRAQLMLGLALARGTASDIPAARTALAKALALAPDDPAVLFGHYQGMARIDGRASPQLLDQLIQASDLAPQNGGIRLAAAQVLIRRGDMAGALRRLRPLASSPHPSSAQKQAQKLVEWLKSGASGGMPGLDMGEQQGTSETGGSD